MMNRNRTFYVKYLDNQPVAVNTHVMNQTTCEFFEVNRTVSELIQAVKEVLPQTLEVLKQEQFCNTALLQLNPKYHLRLLF